MQITERMEPIMKRTAISLFALSVAAMPALAETKSFEAGNFDSLDVNGAIEVIFEQGASHSVLVEQDNGDFSDIDISTKGGELKITRQSLKKKASWNRGLSTSKKNGKLVVKVNGKVVPNYTVRVTSPTISEIDASQSSIVTANDLNTGDLFLDASSSADIYASGTAGAVKIDASSSANISAGGLEANSLDLDASSSADVIAASNGLGNILINISSSADAEVALAGQAQVDIEASSSSDVTLTGTCDQIVVDASSSADVMAEGLRCNTANVSGSSGSDVSVFASQEITANVTSGADVTVLGAPSGRSITKSSGGDVDFAG